MKWLNILKSIVTVLNKNQITKIGAVKGVFKSRDCGCIEPENRVQIQEFRGPNQAFTIMNRHLSFFTRLEERGAQVPLILARIGR